MIHSIVISGCFLLAAFFPPLSASASDALKTTWGEAVQLFHDQKYPEACAKFENWEAETARSGRFSPELHTNLALCYGKIERWDQAAAVLLKSIPRETSPLKRWERWETLHFLQEQIGMKESPASDLGLQLRLLTSTSTLVWTLSLCLWGLLLPWVHFALFGGKRNGVRWTVAALSGTITILAATLLLHRHFNGTPGVLMASDSPEVPVFAKAESLDANQIIQLPRGALVISRGTEGAFIRIDAPLAGWVKKENIVTLD